jgi:hypothetical protein
LKAVENERLRGWISGLELQRHLVSSKSSIRVFAQLSKAHLPKGNSLPEGDVPDRVGLPPSSFDRRRQDRVPSGHDLQHRQFAYVCLRLQHLITHAFLFTSRLSTLDGRRRWLASGLACGRPLKIGVRFTRSSRAAPLAKAG